MKNVTLCFVFPLFTLLSLCQWNSQAQSENPINPLLRGQKQSAPVLLIAHRGASAYAPENTLSAFEKGIRMGAHMFELDVHVSKDGQLVVVHDDTLNRCSDVQKKFPGRAPYWVSDFTLEEIRQLDAGSWYVDELEKKHGDRQLMLRFISDEEKKLYIPESDIKYYKSGEVKHPTLEESLLLAKKLKCLINVEIKQVPRFYPNITAQVVKLIENLNMSSQVIISCFDHYQVAISKKLNPGIATAVLCSNRIYEPGSYCAEFVGADAYNPGAYGGADIVGFDSVGYQQTGSLELDSFTSARKMKVSINVWTVDHKERMKVLIAAGATGIFTDYPNRMVEVLKEMGLDK
jgi:glycerophosphoryl diester phosphodiesterase